MLFERRQVAITGAPGVNGRALNAASAAEERANLLLSAPIVFSGGRAGAGGAYAGVGICQPRLRLLSRDRIGAGAQRDRPAA